MFYTRSGWLIPMYMANQCLHEKAQRAGVAHLYVIAGNIVNTGPAG